MRPEGPAHLPGREAIMATTPASLLAQIDERIDLQLTPEILSKLAFKGITPSQARDRLRVKALQALAEAGQQ